MVHLYISRELQKKMKMKLPANPNEGENPLDWYAGIRDFRGKTFVIVANAETRFGFVIWDVQEEHLKNLGDIIVQGLRDVLSCYGFRQTIIDQLAPAGAAPELYGTSNRKRAMTVQGAAQKLEAVWYFDPDYSPDGLIPEDLHRLINSDSTFSDAPVWKMAAVIQEVTGQKPFGRKAVDLKFPDRPGEWKSGEWEKGTLTVPANMTFCSLKDMLSMMLLKKIDSVLTALGAGRYALMVPARDPDPGDLVEADQDMRLEEYLQEGDILSFAFSSAEREWDIRLRVSRVYENQDGRLPMYRREGGEPDIYLSYLLQKL